MCFKQLLSQHIAEHATQDASYTFGVLQHAGKHDGRAGRKDESLAPLLLLGVLAGHKGAEGARRDKEAHVFAAASRLDEHAPAAKEAAGADADVAVEQLACLEVFADDGRPDATASEANAVVEEGDVHGEERRGAGRGPEGLDKALAGGLLAQLQGQGEGQVGVHGPLPGAHEAAEGVVLARRAAAHVDNLAGEGHLVGGIAPGAWEVVVIAHVADEAGLARLLAVDESAKVEAAERFDEAKVYLGGRGDPFLVASGEVIGVVKPGPHDKGTGADKD